jgi:hypothetical protein
MSTFDDKSGTKCGRFFDLSFPQSGCGRSEAKVDGVACRKFFKQSESQKRGEQHALKVARHRESVSNERHGMISISTSLCTPQF